MGGVKDRPNCDCKTKAKGAKPRVCPHYNHLAICPNSAKEWDYEKNNPLRPEQITPANAKDIWWICGKCNESYQQKPSTRKNGGRCKFCAGKEVGSKNSLAYLEPDIAKEWHPTKNGSLTPDKVTRSVGKKAWWICRNHPELEEGYSYECLISDKTRKEMIDKNGKTRKRRGCPLCNNPILLQDKRDNHFVAECNKVHNNKYQYLSEYKGVSEKILIYCPVEDEFFGVHGKFEQRAGNHKNGMGCPKCDSHFRSRIGGHDLFVAECNKVHNNKYQYLSEYKYLSENIYVFCPVEDGFFGVHGKFEQNAKNHKNGAGCPKCSTSQRCKMGGHSLFVAECNKVHNNKYQYLSEYKFGVDKIEIYCPVEEDFFGIHGSFFQTPTIHKQGSGCPKCSPNYRGEQGGHELFVYDSVKIHGDKYTYMSEYKNCDEKIQIRCSVLNKHGTPHGIFKQTPRSHKQGNGCPKCAYQQTDSRQVRLVDEILNSFSFKEDEHYLCQWSDQKRIMDNKPLRCDRYLIHEKLIVEIDGIQHFNQKGFAKDLPSFIKSMNRDFIKDKYALENGHSMARIPYDMDADTIKNYLVFCINQCRQGKQCYFSYKHFYDQIPPSLLQNNNLVTSLVPCPPIKISKGESS